MIERIRRLLTTPLRGLMRWWQARAARPRKGRPLARTTSRARAHAALRVEAYEPRAQIGGRGDAALFGLTGLGLTLLSEPIQAIVEAVGSESLLPPVFAAPDGRGAPGGAEWGLEAPGDRAQEAIDLPVPAGDRAEWSSVVGGPAVDRAVAAREATDAGEGVPVDPFDDPLAGATADAPVLGGTSGSYSPPPPPSTGGGSDPSPVVTSGQVGDPGSANTGLPQVFGLQPGWGATAIQPGARASSVVASAPGSQADLSPLSSPHSKSSVVVSPPVFNGPLLTSSSTAPLLPSQGSGVRPTPASPPAGSPLNVQPPPVGAVSPVAPARGANAAAGTGGSSASSGSAASTASRNGTGSRSPAGPPAAASGPGSVYTVTSSGGTGASDCGCGDGLIASDVRLAIHAGDTASFDYRSYVADWTGESIELDSYTEPDDGELSEEGGEFSYTPDPEFTGEVTFTYTVLNEATEATATGTVTVTVTNDPPVANNATLYAQPGAAADVNYLAYAMDPDGDALSLDTNTEPTDGTVTEEDGQFTYTPDEGFTGTDSFEYTVTDGHGGTATGVITVIVSASALLTSDASLAVHSGRSVGFNISSYTAETQGNTVSVEAYTEPTDGTVTEEDGQFTYTPDEGFTGTDSFECTVTDGHGGSGTATVTIVVSNSPPVASDAPLLVTAGSSAGFDYAAYSSDADGDDVSLVTYAQPSNGTVSESDGELTYTPAPGYTGPDSFTYTVTDGHGAEATGTVTVSVADNPLVASDVRLAVHAGGTVGLSVSTFASAAGGDQPEVVSITQPADGVATFSTGFVSYAPSPTFTGTDSFTYTVETADGAEATGTVTVTVTDDPPAATDLTVQTSTGTAVGVSLSSLASDPDQGDQVGIVSYAQPASGTLSESSGRFTYTPNPGFVGADSFAYTVTDGHGATASGTVTVDVIDTHALGASDATLRVYAGSPAQLSYAAYATIRGGGSVFLDSYTQPANGSVSANLYALSYFPRSGFTGTDSFTYTVGDNYGETATVTVTVEVLARGTLVASDASLAMAGSAFGKDFNVAAYVSDPNGGWSLDSYSQGANGTVGPDPGNGELRYIPSPGFVGADSFTYTVTDVVGQTATGTVTVTVASPPPTADNLSFVCDIGRGTLISFPGSGGIVTYTEPAHGTIESTSTGGLYDYIPDYGFAGVDSLTYTVTNGYGQTATGTISITVVDDTIIANDYTVTDWGGSALILYPTFAVDTQYDNLDDGGNLHISSVTQPTHGTVSIVRTNGDADHMVYWPSDPYWTGTDSFTYTATNGFGDYATGTITVIAVSGNSYPLPVANNLTFTVSEGYQNGSGFGWTAGLAAGSYNSHTQPSHGTLKDPGNGYLYYVPNPGFTGTDSYSYTVTDGQGNYATGTITIIVVPMSPPIANDINLADHSDESVLVNLNDYAEASPNLGIGSFTVNQPPNGTAAITQGYYGQYLTYTPRPGFTGTDTFTYTVTDTIGKTTTGTVTVTVTNTPPVAGDDTQSVVEGASATFDYPDFLSDADGDGVTLDSFTQPASGTVNEVPYGYGYALRYTPNPGFTGIDSYTYTVDDGHGGTATGTVTVNVAAPAPPSADSVTFLGKAGSEVTINYLSYVSDPSQVFNQGSPDSLVAYSSPAHGTLSNGGYDYTPDPGFIGTDSFTYTVRNTSNGATATGTVTIVVRAYPPSAPDVALAGHAGGNVSFPYYDYASDADWGSASLDSYTQPENGTLTEGWDGLVYTLDDPEWTGTDSFTYTVSDGHGGYATGTVDVTIANNPPVASDVALATQAGSTASFNYWATATDPDGDPVDLVSYTQPENGTLTEGWDGLVYTLDDPEWTGTDSFTYTVSDGHGGYATGTVDVTVVADSPVAVDGSVAGHAGESIEIDAEQYVAVPADDWAFVAGYSDPTNGELSQDGDTLVYTPDAGFTGTDSFTVTFADYNGWYKDATISVVVSNHDPATGDAALADTTGESVSFDPLAYSTDADGDTLSLVTFTQAEDGEVSREGDELVYTPDDPEWTGTDSFTYTVTDGHGGYATGTVDVTVDVRPLTAGDVSLATHSGTPVGFDYTLYASGPVGEELTLDGSTQPDDGTVDGLEYTSDEEFTGTDSYTYTVAAGQETATATVTVDVYNNPPAASDTVLVSRAGEPVEFDIVDYTTDPDGDELTVDSFGQGEHGTVTEDGGVLEYTPDDPDWMGRDSFTYTVADGHGGYATGTITVLDTANWTDTIDPQFLDVAADPIFGDPDGAVATFTSSTGTTPEDYEVTVDWGDGEVDENAVVEGENGEFLVDAAHEYAEPGAFLVQVTVTDTVSGMTAVGYTTATVLSDEQGTSIASVPLGPLPTTVLGYSTPGAAPVAEFVDANLDDTATDFAAVIQWGDGTSAEGAVVGGNGTFKVYGPELGHDYALPGTYFIQVTLEYADGTVNAFTEATVVSGAGTLALTSSPYHLDSGYSVYGVLAEFAGAQDQTRFAALVNWGDGTGWEPATVGRVAGGEYAVSAAHTYGYAGNFPVTIEVQDGTRAGLVGTDVAITVPESDTVAVQADGQVVPANEPLNGVVVGTVESNLPPEDLDVEIEWGDGEESPGELVPFDGLYLVLGSHTYVDVATPFSPGNLEISLVVSTPADGAVYVASAPITVTDWMESAAGPDDLTVMQFVNPRTGAPAGPDAFTATVTWEGNPDDPVGGEVEDVGPLNDGGDGSGGTDNVSHEEYTVTLADAPAFPEEGEYTIDVDVKDCDGASASYTNTALVADAPLVANEGPDLLDRLGEGLVDRGTGEAAGGDVVVGSFTDLNPDAAPGDFTVEIDWGDGEIGWGEAVPTDGGGDFDVLASHGYAFAGEFSVTILVTDVGGATCVLVGSAVAFNPIVETLTEPAGEPLVDVVVGTMEWPESELPEVAVSIDWGDGAVSAGELVKMGGTNLIVGSHEYVTAGDWTITVTAAAGDGALAGSAPVIVSDRMEGEPEGGGGPVADAPLEPLTGPAVVSTVGQDVGALVAQFADGNPQGSPGDFSAEVDWGDGTAGAVTVHFTGVVYNVLGSHNYARPGSYTVAVLVEDVGGASLVLQGTAYAVLPTLAAYNTTARTDDPARADLTPVGDGSVSANTGGVRVSQPLSLNLNAVADNALVYNSNTVGVEPVVEATIAVPAGEVLTSIDAELIWNGAAQGWVRFAIESVSPDGVYTIQLQAHDLITASWIYQYQIDAVVNFADGQSIQESLSAYDPVVVNNTSQFGNGWGLESASRLIVTPYGMLRVMGDGDAEVFQLVDVNTYRSAGDYGTLRGVYDLATGYLLGYAYVDQHGTEWDYSVEGQLLQVVDVHGLATEYGYSFGLLQQLHAPDNSVTTFTWSPTGQTTAVVEPGTGRTVGLAIGAVDNNLYALAVSSSYDTPGGAVDDGYTRLFGYGGALLTSDMWGEHSTSYTYNAAGAVMVVDRGGGDTLTVVAAGVVSLLSGYAVSDEPWAFEVTGLGEHTELLFDQTGRVWQRLNPDGTTEGFARNGMGEVTLYQDPNHFLTTYSYDDGGDVIATYYPDGSSESATYDSQLHRLTSSTDRNGNVTTYTLNGVGDVTAVSDPLGTTTYAYGDGLLTGLVTSTTNADGWTTDTHYDSHRRAYETVSYGDFDTPTEYRYTTYDDNGNVASTSDTTGHTALYEYDSLGRLVETVDPAGNTTWSFYNANDDLVESIDANGVVTDYGYDGRSDLVAVDAGTNASEGERDTIDLTDAEGRVTLTVDPMGRATATAHDTMGRVTATVDGQWAWSSPGVGGFVGAVRVTQDAYDHDGNVTLTVEAAGAFSGPGGSLVVDPNNRATATTYDAMGRPTDETTGVWGGSGFNGDTRVTSHFYDRNGNETLTVDPADVAAATYYNGDDEVTGTVTGTWAWGAGWFTGPTRTGSESYDGMGNVTQTVVGGSETSRTYYNPDGQATLTVDPAGRSEADLYDSDGWLTGTIEGYQLGATGWRLTQYGYDSAGRQVVTVDPTGLQTDTVYDGNGNVVATIEGAAADIGGVSPAVLMSTTGPWRVTRLSYDSFGEETTAIDPLGRETQMVNDADGETTATIVGAASDLAGKSIEYLLSTPGPWRVTTTAYDAFGQATLTTDPTGHEVAAYYDAFGEATLTIDGAELPAAQERVTTAAFDPFGDETLQVDPMGRQTAWSYDADGRAVEEVDGYGSAIAQATTFGYDSFGEPSGETAGYGTTLASTTQSYYDPYGNVTLTVDPMGRQTAYLYDADNEVTGTIEGYQLGAGGWRLTQTLYDGFGQVTESIDPTGMKVFSSYNGDGQLTSQTVQALNGSGVQEGRTTSFGRDIFGDVISTTDPLNRQTLAVVNGDGEVTATVDGAAGDLAGKSPDTLLTTAGPWRVNRSFLDAFGEATLTIDPTGMKVFTSYNGDGVELSQTAQAQDGGGVVRSLTTAFGVDAFGEPVQTTDPMLRVTTASYNKDGQQTSVTTGYGTGDSETEVAYYDALGQETETVDAAGDVTVSVYDALGRVVQSVTGYGTGAAEPVYTYYDADGEATGTVTGAGAAQSLVQHLYDAFGQETLTVDGDNNRIEHRYNADGIETETVDAPGTGDQSIATATVDGFGAVVRTQVEGKPAAVEYADADGEVTGSVDPNGHLTRHLYDAFGQETLTIDPAGHQTAMYYDADGRVTEAVAGYASGAATPSYTGYDGFGRVATTTDGDGRVTANFYDADGEVTLTVAGYGTGAAVATSVSYDADGNVTGAADGLGHATTTEYDGLNRAVSVTDASNRTTHTYYDAAGNVTGAADGLGHLTTSVFDSAGRRVGSVNADGYATNFYYDGDGNLTGELDPDGNLTQFFYDHQGRQTETIDPLGHASYQYYDAAGEVTLSVDQLGRKTSSYYDADGSVTSVVWTNADGSSAGGKGFTYDAAGEVVTASNGVGTYTFTYDGAGRVSTVADPFGVTLTMGYDGGGNRTSVTDTAGGSVTSAFDAAGALSSRSLSASGADASVTFGYDAAGRLTDVGRTSGGTGTGHTTTGYDASGLVTAVVTTAGNGGTVVSETYTHDGAGRLSSKTAGGATVDYGYDAAGQLTSAGSASYGYDNNGVPTANGLTPGADNQVSSDGTWAYTYDAAGELTAKSLIAGGASWGYAYDFDGHLTSATETVGGSVAVQVSYTYDVFGNLVGRTEADSGTVVSDVRYAVDGWDTAKPSPTGNENYDDYAELVPDGSGGWTISLRTAFGGGFDQPLASVSAMGVVSWYAADRQGSVRAVFDNSGSVLSGTTYDSFGNVTSGGPLGVVAYAFQGGTLDSVTGLVHFGDRWFNPVTQQWTSRDPLGLTPGPNDREFTGNGPTNGTDPSGDQETAGTPGPATPAAPAVAQPAPQPKPPATGERLNIRLDTNNIPTSLIWDLIREGKAFAEKDDWYRTETRTVKGFRSRGAGYYESTTTTHYAEGLVYLSDKLPGGRAYYAILAPHNSSPRYSHHWTTTSYRVVKFVQVAEGYSEANVIGNKEAARRFIDLYKQSAKANKEASQEIAKYEGILTLIHFVPGGAAADAIHQGDWGEAAISIVGDAAMITGFGAALKGAKAGRGLFLTSQALEAGVAGVRGTQAAMAFAEGDNAKGYQYLGETTLRLLGLSVNQIAHIKAQRAALEAEARLGTATVGGPCFVAGTPLQTPEGSRPIEEIKQGDLVLSRDEHDPFGPVIAKTVEAVFVRSGQVWELKVNGQTIRTTGIHPFYAWEKGWAQANELHRGDTLLTMKGGWVTVEEVVNTNQWETVYNLRVADFHTYFVGCDEWGFSVWAHNANCVILHEGTEGRFILTRANGDELARGTLNDIRVFIRDHNANPANAADQLSLRARYHGSPSAISNALRENGIDLRTGPGETPGVHFELEPFHPTTPSVPGQGRTGTPARDLAIARDGAYIDFDLLPSDDWRVTNVGPRNTGRTLVEDGRPPTVVEGGGMSLEGRNPSGTNVFQQLQEAKMNRPLPQRLIDWLWGLWNR